MRLPVCESQVLILKELLRADTVAYFRTDVNNPLARFALVGVIETFP